MEIVIDTLLLILYNSIYTLQILENLRKSEEAANDILVWAADSLLFFTFEGG